jgi:ATP-dependent DNA helicase RecG
MKKDPNFDEKDPKFGGIHPKLLKFLQSMGGEYCSIQLLLQKTGLKDRKGLYRRYIVPSVECGWIELLYPDTPNHPRQKYRITDAGRKLLSQNKD